MSGVSELVVWAHRSYGVASWTVPLAIPALLALRPLPRQLRLAAAWTGLGVVAVSAATAPWHCRFDVFNGLVGADGPSD